VAADLTILVCPASVCRRWPSPASQIRAVSSQLVVAINLLSGEKTTESGLP
jgi:hypothetical protein